MKQKTKTFDFLLMISPLLLAGFGVVMVYSASMVTSVIVREDPAYSLALRQAMYLLIGLAFFLFASYFKYTLYLKLTKWIVLLMFISLIWVELFGDTLNNAKSWVAIGPFSVQPAEFVKIGLIIYLAAIYTKKLNYIDDFFKAVIPPLIITSALTALIIKQPDVGTAAIVFAIACTVIFSSGIKFKHLSLLILTGLIVLSAVGFHMASDERISRFTGAYHPFEDIAGDGYQLIQSYIAIGTGGLSGVGIGQGIQKLGYLTQAESDFIMAVIAEELGLFGVLFVLVNLSIIVIRGLFIAKKCENPFGTLLAIGISSMVGIQAVVNLGAISGLLPITGVPLPFVSAGGSSLVMLLFSVGILNNIARHVNYQRFNEETTETEETKLEDTRATGRLRRNYSS
ncbi:FtsW/RodA/SpoVE family cell cycle protein [Gracilibacillus thailandensis]|uniref:Probable peptidoglycan glycosyltransferase FtsW n=1 Tax=Gracilibacillus thailandensis TaxID=563735 RepID=A0A6N7R0J4_9BACI|nr:FtsW/RodA/SpoVE family cell cycle protein [Gracilibacillus thailandensis]MRI66695.1 cell division protein FtsW [Gracilibacillus thailandensis]